MFIKVIQTLLVDTMGITTPSELHSCPNSTTRKFSAGTSTTASYQKTRFWNLTNVASMFYIFLSLSLMVLLIVVIPFYASSIYEDCDSQGHFQYDAYQKHLWSDFHFNFKDPMKSLLDLWNYSSLVSVSLTFGKFSFSQAKWINLAFDIVFGRCTQVILGFVSYRVISGFLLYVMEETAVPNRLYTNISFRGCSPISLYRVCTVTPQSQLWKDRKASLFVIGLVLGHMIAFPSIAGAMTGYPTMFEAHMKVQEGEATVKLDSPDVHQLFVHIGNCSIFDYPKACNLWGNDTSVGILETNLTVSNGLNEKNADFLVDQILNQEQYCQNESPGEWCSQFQLPNGTNVTVSPTGSLNISDVPGTVFEYDGSLYNNSEVNKNGLCIPTAHYHWGFSYKILFIFSVLNLLWAIAMWALWLVSHKNDGIRHGHGMYRAAVDLVDATKETIGDSIYFLSDEQIERKLNEARVGFVKPDAYGQHLTAWDWKEPYRRKYRSDSAA